MRSFVLFVVCFSATLATAQDPWPMERHDRWGSGTSHAGPIEFVNPWVYRRIAPNTLVSHGPAIRADGNGFFGIWVPTAQMTQFTSDGAIIGAFTTANFAQSSPALGGNGLVYIHAPRHFGGNPPGRVFAVNPVTMDYEWFFQTAAEKVNDWDSASPTVGPEGDVAIPSTIGSAWRLDGTTGAIVWVRSGLQGSYHTMVFTRDDARVLVANGSSVTALDWATGAIAWTKNLGSEAGAPGVAPDGTIVVGSDGGTIFGLDPSNGATRWTRLVLDRVRAGPAFSPDGSVAYVNSYDFRCYAIRVSDGVRLWSFTNDSQTNPVPPSVDAAGRIYYQNRTGHMICLSPSGSLVWDVILGGGRGSVSIDTEGKIYVGDTAGGGGLVVISQRPIKVCPESVTIPRGTLVSGTALDLCDADDQRVVAHVGSLSQDTEPLIDFRVFATSPSRQLHKMKVTVEAQCDWVFPQTLSLYVPQTGTWEVVDTRNSTLADSRYTVLIQGNPSRFVDQANKQIRGQLTVGTLASDFVEWQARVDELTLELEPVFE